MVEGKAQLTTGIAKHGKYLGSVSAFRQSNENIYRHICQAFLIFIWERVRVSRAPDLNIPKSAIKSPSRQGRIFFYRNYLFKRKSRKPTESEHKSVWRNCDLIEIPVLSCKIQCSYVDKTMLWPGLWFLMRIPCPRKQVPGSCNKISRVSYLKWIRFLQIAFWKPIFWPCDLLMQLTETVWTTLIGDHPGIIPVKFGQNPMSGFRGEDV